MPGWCGGGLRKRERELWEGGEAGREGIKGGEEREVESPRIQSECERKKETRQDMSEKSKE